MQRDRGNTLIIIILTGILILVTLHFFYVVIQKNKKVPTQELEVNVKPPLHNQLELNELEEPTPKVEDTLITVDDNFDDPELNQDRWELNCPDGTVSVENNTVSFSTPKVNPFPTADPVCEIRFKLPLMEDFDTWVTYSGFNYKTDKYNQGTPLNITAKILFTDQKYPQSNVFPPDNFAYVLRQNYPNHEYQSYVSNSDTHGYFWNMKTDATEGKLRLQRIDNTYYFFYDEGNGWILINSAESNKFTGYIYLGLRTETKHPAATVYLSDFHLELPR